jgi:hypothetical protein
VWNWIRDNWLKLLSKWGESPRDLSKIIEAVSSRFVTARKRDELKAFADSIVAKGLKKLLFNAITFLRFVSLHLGTVYQQFQFSIERINAAIEWRTGNLPAIVTFVRPSKKSSITVL